MWLGSVTDRILLLCSLLMIAAGWWWLQQHQSSGPPMVHIYHADKLLARYALHAADAVTFQAVGDVGLSTIQIADGQVLISHAPCANQRCRLTGPRKHTGDILACVPNRIFIHIQGDGDDLALDAVAE